MFEVAVPVVRRCCLMWLLGVSRGDTLLFLPNFMEVRDVGACVVRLWSHVVAPVFHELLCLGGCVPRYCFRIVFDSTGSVGVMFGSTLVVGHGVYSVPLVASFLVGPGCELQKSVAAVAGCACCERGCCFARAAVGFILGLRICMGVPRRLKEPTCGVAFTGAGL
ncbi:hypothetical protein Taro_047056 [Colocasia esculenta]|uniref:Uncharacterized protein n=1 Tax=Colocasia esculenta TaxID=4460 RepID=A0A843X0A0_COLES|nr:hypothetical protein [Colocasia esculenta]